MTILGLVHYSGAKNLVCLESCIGIRKPLVARRREGLYLGWGVTVRRRSLLRVTWTSRYAYKKVEFGVFLT